MEKYTKLALKTVEILNSIERMHDFHLTSVAKAIEAHSNEKIKIIFMGEPKKKNVGSDFWGMMLSQKLSVAMVGCNVPHEIVEHFIYYSEKRDPQEIRFAVAHELGHIILHHSNKNRKRKYVHVGDKLESSFYVIEFTDKEEAEADLFAAILSEQRSPPRRPRTFVLPCVRKLNMLKKKGFFKSGLAKMIPSEVACCYKCSPADHCSN